MLHALDERVDQLCVVLCVSAGAKLLQPADIAADATQSFDILHEHPEVPTPIGEVHNVVCGQNHRRHGYGLTHAWIAESVNMRGTSLKLTSVIPASRMAARTEESQSVRSSHSRSEV